jgi:hypothetical protein
LTVPTRRFSWITPLLRTCFCAPDSTRRRIGASITYHTQRHQATADATAGHDISPKRLREQTDT